ncbi:Signal recognition particle 19 kDa protein [Myotis brandtii]|uniref:Signal recognition particle 19 kDa protein n=1 Tax=Myotis brandtii TaxID=109478 RepID=S7NAW3_MYOBR|nr:PREDICTED: signal recognition particle 19 kDa protein [Myotis brandtii]EPQ14191.1 Signal recognition particle 19 kDa protein [Myotis brandtii]
MQKSKDINCKNFILPYVQAIKLIKEIGVSPQGALRETACAAVRSLTDQYRFMCIYPAYLNNEKTIQEGRRIPISKAAENPTATEIQDECSAVGLNAFLEKNKMYSREWNPDAQYRGRVRVQLKQEDGSLCLVQFPSHKSVMLYAAEMIPKLKTRTQKTGGSDQTLQQGEGSKKGKGKKK